MNTKQRISMYLAVALFVGAMLCAFEGWALLALLLCVLGIFGAIGAWAYGRPQTTDPDNAEWMNAIR